ncbi:MAG: MFS transporter [Ruminiclostridium sp.]|jgi:PPP family 3-phenylpropionic acid transporter|nr:MFS transporter [Ruminiclostridium sp.]
MKHTLRPTAQYTVIQGTYWASYCCVVAFSSVYLLSLGFTNVQIGTLISVSGLLSALLQPLVSKLADGLRRMSLRQFTALLTALFLAGGATLLFLPGRQTGMYAFLLILVQLIMPLTSALGMAAIDGGFPLNFGVARSAGSILYGAASALCGRLVLEFGERSIPAAMTVLNVILLLAILAFRFADTGRSAAPEPQEETPERKGGLFVFRYRHALPLLLGVVCLFISHNILNVYTFQIVQPLGGDSEAMGDLLFVQSLLELPVMFLFSWMLTKKSSRFWVQLSGTGFFFHALGMWLAPNMTVAYLVQIFEMTGYALYTLAAIYFVNEQVEEAERVQGQAWFAMAITLGNVLASFAGGALLDWAGAWMLLAFATVTGGGGMVVLALLLGKNSRALQPKDP